MTRATPELQRWFIAWSLAFSLTGCPRPAPEAPAPIPVVETPLPYADSALLMPQLGHSEVITWAALSPDRTRVVTASWDWTGAIWDAQSGILLHRLDGHGTFVNSAVYSPDGTRILTASNDQTAAVWDAGNGTRIRLFQGHEGKVVAAKFSPDGNHIVTASHDDTAGIWKVATGTLLHRLDAHDDMVSDASWSPDGDQLVTASADRTAAVWSATGALQHRLTGHDGWVWTARFSPNGQWVVTTSQDATAALWDANHGTLVHRLRGHEDSVDRASFSPDSSSLITASSDGTAAVWDVGTGQRRFGLEGHGQRVGSVEFSPDGTHVLTAGTDGAVAIWDAHTGRLLYRQVLHDSVTHAAFGPDGQQVVTGGWDHTATLWDVGASEPHQRFGGHGTAVYSAALTPDQQTLATADDEGTIVLWDLPRSTVRQRIPSGDSPVWTVAFSPDGSRFVAAGTSAGAQVWNTEGGAPVATMSGHEKVAWEAWFSNDGEHVVTASLDRSASIWDAHTGQELQSLPHKAGVRSAAFSPDGTHVATGTDRGTIVLWKADGNSPLKSFEGLESDRVVWSVAFSPDGNYVLSGGGHSAVLWSPEGEILKRFDPPSRRGIVRSALFSPDGQDVLVARRTNATIWGRNGTLKIRFRGHVGRVNAATYSRDGSRVITASGDGTTRIWDAQTGAWLLTLLSFSDGSWAVVDPEGRFDGSDDGEVDGLAWVIGGEGYRLDQLRAHYYDPGLLAKVLGFRSEPQRAVPPLSDVRPPPKVRLDGPTADGQLQIQLEDRGAGVGRVTIRLNGSDASSAVHAACPELTRTLRCQVDLSTQPTWVPGQPNKVQASAADASETVRSRALTVMTQASGPPPVDPPDLWVLAVGTSDYSGTALDLDYAATDAIAMAKALEVAGREGFGRRHTHVRVLTTDDSKNRPSRASVDEALQWLQGADALDTVVVYLSGHGVAYTDAASDDYYYLLPDAASMDDVRQPKLRALRTVSGQDLADALTEVPALKRVVILDTCSAGKADAPLSATKSLSSDAIRAHARARERTGAWFLAGAAADQVSFEASRFGQGILTYTLLEGMLGPALAEDQVSVARLFAHAENKVPEYAKGIGGIQKPYTRRGASDFPLGALPAQRREDVPVGRSRPVVVRSLIVAMQGDRPGPDTARVGPAIDRRLRAEADGEDPPIVVFDTDHLEEAWQVAGGYSESDGSLQFKGQIIQLGTAQSKALNGSGEDAEALATELVRQIMESGF